MSAHKLIAIGVFTLSIGAAAFLLHPASAQAALYNASGVLGQPDFTSSANTRTQSGMSYPDGAVLDAKNHRLFVDECSNNSVRELVYQLDVHNNLLSANASYVLGQPDFTSNIATTTQSSLGCPFGGAAYDSQTGRLFVPDQNYYRVMVFDVNPSTIHNGENASYVIGQPNFTTGVQAQTQNGFGSEPNAIVFDSATNRIFVGDYNANRVMVFDVDPSTIHNGENASYVLGQPDFTSNDNATTRKSVNQIEGLAFDSATNRLFVADGENNRVMIFDVNPSTIANNEDALNVLGQPDFTSNTATSTQSGLGFPDGASFDPLTNNLFVSDENFNRVMIFNVATSSITNGENALNVLGQPDFISNTATTTQSGFNDPEGNSSFDPVNHLLFVPDSSNNRVLQFSFIVLTTSSLPGGTLGTSYSQSITATSSQGTVSFSLFSGSLPAGLSMATSTGAISGTPSVAGTSSFTIEADDTFSTGTFLDRKAYTVTVAAAPTPTPSTAPSVGGGGLPAVAYMPPVPPTGGFQVSINNAANISSSPQVTLTLTAGSDIQRMAVSNTADFTSVGQEPFSSSKSWNLCWANPTLMQPADCASGSKTVYVKFFTSWGQASPVVSASIKLQNVGNAAGAAAQNSQSSSTDAPYAPDTLVNDHGTIYLILGNDRFGFTSWNSLVGLGYAHRAIVRRDTSGYQNSSYLLSDPKQAHPWGSWLLSRGTVYYSHPSGLIGVASWDVFLANGGKASLLVPANAADLAQPRLNSVLAPHDGRILQ